MADAYPYIVRGTPNMVAYWRLGESSGTNAADAGGLGLSGTYTGGVTLGLAGAVASDVDTSAEFDGVDDYVSVAHNAALNAPQFTLEAWIYPTLIAGDFRAVIGKGNPTERAYTLYIDPTGNILSGAFTSAPNVYEGLVSGGVVALNQWQHVAYTYGGANARLYLNGVETASVAETATPYAPTGLLAIGRIGDAPNNYFQGRIDEAAVYSRALTAVEIRMHYAAALVAGIEQSSRNRFGF